MSYHLIESSVDLILGHLKENIAQELANVRAAANLGQNRGLAAPPPQEWFIAPLSRAYRAPAVFIIPTELDMKKDRGANHINATAQIDVGAIVEAQRVEDVARICWRYQAALQKLLDNTSLTSADAALKITCIVRGGKFGEEYDPSDKPGTSTAVFRKGVLLRVDVEIYEEL